VGDNLILQHVVFLQTALLIIKYMGQNSSQEDELDTSTFLKKDKVLKSLHGNKKVGSM
jgi:hypothetical protein